MKKYVGKIGLFFVAIVWGTGFVGTAVALEHFGPSEVIAMRMTIAFGVFLLFNLYRIKQLKKENVLKGALVGLLLYLGFIFQTVGLQYTTPSNNAFLTATNIVIVPFLSFIFLRRLISYRSILGALVTFAGIGFISLQSGFTQINRGDILTLICALFFALQILTTDIFAKKIETWELLLAQLGTASMLAWIGLLFSGEQNILKGQGTFTLETLLPIIYLGLVSTLFAYFVQTYSQKTTSSTETAVILSTEAFFGMLSSVLILHEVITKNMAIGAILIFCGILVVEVDFLQFKQLWRKIDINS